MSAKKAVAKPVKKLPRRQAAVTAQQFIAELDTHKSAAELKKYHRYFTFDEDNPGKGDRFIGVRMGQVFALAAAFIDLPPAEIEKLLESPIHEVRAGGCSIMGKLATHKKTPESRRKELYDLYLRRHDRINAWDLVDLAAYKVVGSYLYDFEKPRAVLYRLARSRDMWERRSAIVSTLNFIGHGDVTDTFKLAELLLHDKEELVRKGTGWALRYAGDKEPEQLLEFLDKHAATMPRVTLRYTIEKLSKKQREAYLGMKKAGA